MATSLSDVLPGSLIERGVALQSWRVGGCVLETLNRGDGMLSNTPEPVTATAREALLSHQAFQAISEAL